MQNLLLHASTKEFNTIFKPFSPAHQNFISKLGTLSLARSRKAEGKGLNKALKILDLVVSNVGNIGDDARHHRLIQGCLQDLLEVGKKSSNILKEAEPNPTVPPSICHRSIFRYWRKNSLVEVDDLMLFIELHKRGIELESYVFSSILSSCGATSDIGTGMQLHALMVKLGSDKHITIGSSLISLYSKCGNMNDSYRVFQFMPEKNIVSWTAIITGFAQHWQVETCLHLFISMRRSMFDPNDFTFASLLSVLTSSAAIGLGRSVQCLELRMGFDSYTHVSNALISMYAKCGSIDEARCVFEKISRKDLISWNSLIFGYAQFGLGEQAIELLKDMDESGIKPDAISFLGALSSCRHVGLLEQGHRCFKMMLECGIEPGLDHYSCIVDLLGRAGLLEEALDFIERMPVAPNAVIWGSLLSSCRLHGNVWMGIQAAETRLLLKPGCAATHVQLANLYASVGRWDRVAEIRKLMKERHLKTTPGYSWIEIGDKVHRFKAEDVSNTRGMLAILDSLACHMEVTGLYTYNELEYSSWRDYVEV